MSITDAMGKLKTIVLNLIFPCKCVFCGKLLHITTDTAVCMECMNELDFCIAHTRCRICGNIIETGKLCEECRAYEKRNFEKISSVYVYADKAKSALLRFKNISHEGYARVFAIHMATVLKYDLKEKVPDIIIAVPPRPSRLKKEGYDQAGSLAKELSENMNIPFCSRVMEQIEERKKQSGLSAAERKENVHNNYRVVKRDKIKGKTVVLVDDICTTGATLDECARSLKKSGAKEVYCVTAARA